MGAFFRFVHCADLHLGSRFRGLSQSDPARAAELRGAVFRSFSRIVNAGLREGADCMFVSGDAFDEGTVTPRTRAFLADELRRFGRPVFICRGNHDPRTEFEAAIPYPPNVHEFGTEPERVPIPGVPGAEAVGASFRDWHEERNLPSMLRGTPGMFTVACVHCDVDNPSAEYAYSPCSRSDLLGRGVDYWALGHIHKRAVLSEDPWIVYPGNIQGRSFRETGEKGAYIVTVEDGRVAEARFVPTQEVAWYDEEFDITGLDLDGLAEAVSSRVPRGSALRATLTGSGPLDRAARRDPAGMASMLSSRTGVEVARVDAMSTESVDVDARRGGRDMAGLAISCGDSLKGSGREAILGVIRANAVMRPRMEFFESLSDAQLEALVDSAVRSLASSMEAAR